MVPQIGRYIMPQKCFSLIVDIYNNTSDMHFHSNSRYFEIARGKAKQKSRHFEGKVGKV